MLKTFAEDLRSVREEKNISLKSISQQTRLNITILENIENGDFTFQPQAYIRAFLKQYINSLDLDMEETLFDYDLARSGKYKSKRDRTIPVQKPVPEKEAAPDEIKPDDTDDSIQIEESPKKKIEETKPEDSGSPKEKITGTNAEKKKPADENTVGKSLSLKQPGERKQTYTAAGPERKSFPASVLSSPIVKNIFLIIFIALVLLGVYSLINILFLEGSGDSPEIIRQNFDEVVKEQEKKILGKKTPEEIQDSIRQAAEMMESSKDSITLKITSIDAGSIFLVTDSVNYEKPQKIEFGKNEIGVFKAGKSFFLSSGNTDAFKATVNNAPVKFGKASVSKVKITKDGIKK